MRYGPRHGFRSPSRDRRCRVHRRRPRPLRPPGRGAHRRRLRLVARPLRGGGAARSAPSAPSRPPRSSSRPPDVDVVHICTPNHLHLPLAEAALAAGKHVICEKPLATDVAGARRLVDAAAAAGTAAAVPFVYRYYPTVREARERVRSGATGPVRLAPRHLPAGLAADPEDDNWRVDSDARRRLARVRRHRLALVRPRRVRHRPPHRAAQRPHADRDPASACTPSTRAAFAPRQRRRRDARRRHRGRRGRAVRDRRRRDRQHGHQPDLARPQEPPLARGRRRRARP